MCTLVRCSYHAKRFNEKEEDFCTVMGYLGARKKDYHQAMYDFFKNIEEPDKGCDLNEECKFTKCDIDTKVTKGDVSSRRDERYYKNMSDRPVFEHDWRTYTINCADSPYLWRK